jgi:hypothetical protein
MNITLDKLVQLNACQEAIAWFKIEFPNGIKDLTPETLALCERDDWVCWLACKLSKEYRYWCAGVAFREVSRIHPSLQSFAMNVTPKNWRSAAYAYAAAYAADAASDAAYAAYAADAAATDAATYAADAAAYAADAAARKKVYSELRQRAVRILCAL